MSTVNVEATISLFPLESQLRKSASSETLRDKGVVWSSTTCVNKIFL
jgi:hypothetical protein